MELAIPLIALGSLYVISNQNKEKENLQNTLKSKHPSNLNKENFESMKQKDKYLPNTKIPVENYPIMNNSELINNTEKYPNPNEATSEYFNQNLYEQKERQNIKVGDNIQQIYSLSGNYLSSKEFQHNNMVPFNGAKPKGQIYNNSNAETILDNYLGSGSQVIKKIEQAPLFKPQENVQWAYGAPNMSEFYQSRVNPALKNNNVKPFESLRVGPGLDQGYGINGSNGYNSGMEARDKWLPKNVDELRIATNPKQEFSLSNHEGPANSFIKNVGIEGKMEKYRPDTFFINNQERWLTTTGAQKAQRNVSQEILLPVKRDDISSYQTGTPSASMKNASYVPSQYEEPKNKVLEGFDVGPSCATSSRPELDNSLNLNSYSNLNNNRALNNQPRIYNSGFSKTLGAVVAPLMDVFRPSKKEEYVNNIRVYGANGSNVPANYVLTSGDIPNPTIKESTLYTPNGYIGNQASKDGAYYVSKQQAISNQRTTTQSSSYNGVGGSGTKIGARNYQGDYRQTNNESKEKSIAGRMNSGNASIFNPYTNVSITKTERQNTEYFPPASSVIGGIGPTISTYGNYNHNIPNVHNIGCERIEPQILSALKSNPYVHPLTPLG